MEEDLAKGALENLSSNCFRVITAHALDLKIEYPMKNGKLQAYALINEILNKFKQIYSAEQLKDLATIKYKDGILSCKLFSADIQVIHCGDDRFPKWEYIQIGSSKQGTTSNSKKYPKQGGGWKGYERSD